MIKKFVMFALNFHYNWVEDCFLEEAGESMTKHLQGKWDQSYERAGAVGAMVHFYASLDRTNSEIVDKYLENYKG